MGIFKDKVARGMASDAKGRCLIAEAANENRRIEIKELRNRVESLETEVRALNDWVNRPYPPRSMFVCEFPEPLYISVGKNKNVIGLLLNHFGLRAEERAAETVLVKTAAEPVLVKTKEHK